MRLRVADGPADELVLHGGGEVLRLPLTPAAAVRVLAAVRALPRLRPLLPLAVPAPRLVGVLPDGETPFSAEPRLPGVVVTGDLDPIAAGQLAGVRAGLSAVAAREARQWGVPGDGDALTSPLLLLAAPGRGLLSGAVGWDLVLR